MNHKVLVTGGSGYIGSALRKKLKADNFDFKENLHSNILDTQSLDKAIEGHTVVYHLASPVIVQESIQHPLYYWENIVIGTRNVVMSCLKYNARLIFSSTKLVEVYCEKCGNLLSPYASAKLQAEKVIQQWLKNYAILRIPNVFDYAGLDPYKTRLIPRLIAQAKGGVIRIYPPTTDAVELIELEEIVDILINFLDKGIGVFRIHGTPYTIGELADRLATVYKAKVVVTS